MNCSGLVPISVGRLEAMPVSIRRVSTCACFCWSRGDNDDNALAEAVNASYLTELINRGKPPGAASMTSSWQWSNGRLIQPRNA